MAAAIARSHLLTVLRDINDLLGEMRQSWALIGGLAVSAQTGQARFTQDVDLVIAVADDAAAEALVFALSRQDYRVVTALEHNFTNRMATVRLAPPKDKLGILLDLLFASIGIEGEIVAAAELVEIVPRFQVPVARTGHLVAMKLLSMSETRPQDRPDLQALLADIAPAELTRAREAIQLIEQRGNSRGRSLADSLDHLLATFRPPSS